MINKTNEIAVLGVNSPERIMSRFKILKSLLSGKQDISTGREDMDIISDVPLSATTIRAFLNELVMVDYVKKEFIKAGGTPCGPGWSSHYEYTLAPKGLKYLEAQLKLWAKTEGFDKRFAEELIKRIPDFRKKQAATALMMKKMEARYKKMGIKRA